MGFSIFFMQSPSFLDHQRILSKGHGRSDCRTLLGMTAMPSDNHIRSMLDGNDPVAVDGLFIRVLEAVAAAEDLAAAFRRCTLSVLRAPADHHRPYPLPLLEEPDGGHCQP